MGKNQDIQHPLADSWLDLEAVGDFVSGDQIDQQGSTNLFPSMVDYSGGAFASEPPSWGQMQNGAGWQFDLNGNLLF